MLSADFIPKVDPAHCTGCGRCSAACPKRLFSLEASGYRKYAVMSTRECCSRCLRCLAECPVGAITKR